MWNLFEVSLEVYLVLTCILILTHVSTPSRSLRSSGTELLTVPKARTKRHGEAAFSFYALSLLLHFH